jgi:hypothetical protein
MDTTFKEGIGTTTTIIYESPLRINATSPTWSPCQYYHTWTYSGLPYDLEGMPCDCGKMIYHSETCPCCGHQISNHKKAEY